ncbi:hypothetical protein M1247_03575 [Mycobacterium sp. 21AC1]|uniref:hypothetical protein n=1 Tax=[Mycobacterium] appelbergii TaxID=2939269 RepID=UPI00293900B7|nr:hypothetical protein [Mycobacterium sp. 21AC1]MDV3123984.1 hypothetical protein [Mycobacterium sp. 21AC1]
MTRIRARVAAVVAVSLLAAGCGLHGEDPERGAAMSFAVGDCLSVPAGTPSVPQVVRAGKVDCNADPSYTVGAVADGSGDCPSTEYQHLPAEFADPSTARLCLVPNLVAEHCYELGLPAGVMELADCADRGQGVLVQVTQRLDVRDKAACPSATGHFAWPYPAPARTYCTRTVH